MRLVPTHAPLLFEVQVDTRDVTRLPIGDRATVKLEALPWQQFGLAYGELKALTPDTLAPGMKPHRDNPPRPVTLKAPLTRTLSRF